MLRLNEHYLSVQGEGPRTGVPTQFVRFAGCNMRCPGWPCDTQHAIEPKLFLNDGKTIKIEAADLAKEMRAYRIPNICITGGEPFLQENEDLLALWNYCKTWARFEVFTNGSFPFPVDVLKDWSIMMDWKLPGSGEYGTKADVRYSNAIHLKWSDGIKFVIVDELDFKTAIQIAKDIDSARLYAQKGPVQYWVAPAWGRVDPKDVVQWMIDEQLHTWKLNIQTHKYIWEPSERGV